MAKYHSKLLPSVDPNGKKFSSYSRMCKAYGKKPSDVHRLISSGTSLAEALGFEAEVKEESKPVITVVKHEESTIDKKVGNRSVEITAPNGITYPSIQKMCEAYGIKYTTYKGRIAMGKSLEEALLTPQMSDRGGTPKKCVDHKGNEYDTITEMCEAYGIKLTMFYNRHTRLGWTLQEALEGKSKNIKSKYHKNSPCVDYDGNSFNTAAEMCEFYGIPFSTFYNRYNIYKWSLKESLTKPLRTCSLPDEKVNNTIKRIFGSIENFKNECIKCKLSIEVAKRRMADGITSHDEIMAPARYGSYGKKCTDHNGKVYPTITSMCYAYNILPEIYYNRINRGWSLEDALTVKDSEEAKELNRIHKQNDDNFYDPDNVSEEVIDEPIIGTLNESDVDNILVEETYNEESVADEPTEELDVDEEIPKEVIDSKVNDDMPVSEESVPNIIVKYDKPTTMDKFLALIGFMHCMNCEITLDDVRKMLADHDCEEYTYIKGLLE